MEVPIIFYKMCLAQVLSKMCTYFGIVAESVQKFRRILDKFLTHFGHIARGFLSLENCVRDVEKCQNLIMVWVQFGHRIQTWTPFGASLGHLLDMIWTHCGYVNS